MSQSIREPDVDDEPEALRLGWLGDTIGYRLRLAQSASFQAFSQLTGDVGLRPGRYALLQLIDQNPGVSQTVLSRALGRDKSTLTPMLGDLERRGLIVRQPDPADRRGRRLGLTAAGKVKLDNLARCAARHEARLDALFRPEQKRELLKLLAIMTQALDSENPLPPADIDED